MVRKGPSVRIYSTTECLHVAPAAFARAQRKDIPCSLWTTFLKRLPKPVEISSLALQMLMAYPWRKKIRELKNVVESAALIARQGTSNRPAAGQE